MSTPQIELIQQQLTMCQADTLRVAGSVSEADRFKPLKEGKAHPAWLIGHLANTIETVVNRWMLLEEGRLPKGFGRKFAPDFAGGLPITPNPADYPAWDEVVDLYAQLMTAAIEGIEKFSDTDLPEPLPGELPEPMRGFFSSIGKTLNIMVLHDSYHRGQIGMLSKLSE